MPNNLVFNNVANELKTAIYGTTAGGTLTAVLVEADGAVSFRALSSATDTVTVTGQVSVVATDLDIRNLSSALDTVTVTGQVSVVATDLDIRNLAADLDTVTVTGQVSVVATDLDIRNLSAALDTVTVTGQVSVIATDLDIRNLSADLDTVTVTGIVETIGVTATEHYAEALLSGSGNILTENTLSKEMYSFYVKNAGGATLTAQLAVSPTDVTDYYIADDTAVAIAANSSYIFVPKHYMNYTRISYNAGAGVSVEAYYNAQS